MGSLASAKRSTLPARAWGNCFPGYGQRPSNVGYCSLWLDSYHGKLGIFHGIRGGRRQFGDHGDWAGLVPVHTWMTARQKRKKREASCNWINRRRRLPFGNAV